MLAGGTVRFGSVRSVVTQRLVLRPWTEEDRAAWLELATNPSVVAHICTGTPPPEAVIDERLKQAMEPTEGPGVFACEQLDEPGLVIGLVGFAPPTFLPELQPVSEIEWRFLPDYWGRGFGTESAAAALSWAFNADLLNRVVACVQPADRRSAAVAERLGMKPLFRTLVPHCPRWTDVFELTSDRWGQE